MSAVNTPPAQHEIPTHGGLYEFRNGQMVAMEGGPPSDAVSAPEKSEVSKVGTDATPGAKK